MQSVNEFLTGTSYCGPGTKTNARPSSSLDEACRRHDRGYRDNWYYIYNNPADKRFIRDLQNSEGKGFRQRFTRRVAQALFGTKAKFAPYYESKEKSLGNSDMEYKNGWTPMAPRRRARSRTPRIAVSLGPSRTLDFTTPRKSRSRSLRRKSASKRSKSNGRVAGVGAGSGFSAGAGGGGRVTFSYGKKRKYSKKKPVVTKGFVRAIQRTESKLQAPVRQLVTGYGRFQGVANTNVYICPVISTLWTTADRTLVLTKGQHNVTDYYRCWAKISLHMEVTNTSNVKAEFSVYRVVQRKEPAADAATVHPMDIAMDADAADEPAGAGSVTLADQLTNFDMDQQQPNSASESSLWSGGSQVMYSMLGLHAFPKMNRQFKVQKIKKYVLLPDDTCSFVLHGGGRSIMPADDAAGSVERWKPHIFHFFRIHTYPHPYSAAEAGNYVIGTPAVNLDCVWTKYYNIKPEAKIGVIARPVQYITNDRTSQTAFDVITDVNATQVTDAGA